MDDHAQPSACRLPGPGGMTASSDLFAALTEYRVVPVVEVECADDAVSLARALAKAGLPVLELTLRTPAALEAIKQVATQCKDVLVGAGTVLGPDMVEAAAQAGAQFGVSPGLSLPTLLEAAKKGLPFIPGVVTPTETLTALEHGARHLKFFPAEAYGGASTVAALAAPLASSEVRFMPTGGVSAANAADYLRVPSVFAVGGTWIAPRADIAAGHWTEIAVRAKAASDLVRTLAQEKAS